MEHQDKINWMAQYAAKHGVALTLQGECGFGRECVGILVGDSYPDYEWTDEETWDRIDNNGDVWTPDDAYHKHPCVAVLGRGEKAESQLYEWLKWFDDNGFVIERGSVKRARPFDAIELLMGKHLYCRMVRPNAELAPQRDEC